MTSATDLFFIGVIISMMLLFGYEHAQTKRRMEDAAEAAVGLDPNPDARALMDAYAGLLAWAADYESLLLDCMVPSISRDDDRDDSSRSWQFRRFSEGGVSYYATTEVDVPFYALGRSWGHRKDALPVATPSLPMGADQGRVYASPAGPSPDFGRIQRDWLGLSVHPFLYRYGAKGDRVRTEVSTKIPVLFSGDVAYGGVPIERSEREGYGNPSIFYRPCLSRSLGPYPDSSVRSGAALDVRVLSPVAEEYRTEMNSAGDSTGALAPTGEAKVWFLPPVWEGGYLPASFAGDAKAATMRTYLDYPRMGVGPTNLVFHAAVRFFMPAKAVDRFREKVFSAQSFFHRGLCSDPHPSSSDAERESHFKNCHRNYLLSVLASGGYDFEIVLTAVPSGPPGAANRGRGEGRMSLRRVRETLREIWRRGERAPLRQRWGYLQAVGMPSGVPALSPGLPDAKRIVGRSYPGHYWDLGFRPPRFSTPASAEEAGGRHFASNYFLTCMRYSSVLALGARYADYADEERMNPVEDSAYFGVRKTGTPFREDYKEYFAPPYFAYSYENASRGIGDPFPLLGFHPILPGTMSEYRSVLPAAKRSSHFSSPGRCPDHAFPFTRTGRSCIASACVNGAGRMSHHDGRDSSSGAVKPNGIPSDDYSLDFTSSGGHDFYSDYANYGEEVRIWRRYETAFPPSEHLSDSDGSIYQPFNYPIYFFGDMPSSLSCRGRNSVYDRFHAFNRACGSPALSAQSIDALIGGGAFDAAEVLQRRLPNPNQNFLSSLWRNYQQNSHAWHQDFAVYAAVITRADVAAYRNRARARPQVQGGGNP